METLVCRIPDPSHRGSVSVRFRESRAEVVHRSLVPLQWSLILCSGRSVITVFVDLIFGPPVATRWFTTLWPWILRSSNKWPTSIPISVFLSTPKALSRPVTGPGWASNLFHQDPKLSNHTVVEHWRNCQMSCRNEWALIEDLSRKKDRDGIGTHRLFRFWWRWAGGGESDLNTSSSSTKKRTRISRMNKPEQHPALRDISNWIDESCSTNNTRWQRSQRSKVEEH